MKIIRFSDGLANRMFQYSCYLYLLEQGYEAAIDDTTPHYLEHDAVSWNKIFPHAKYEKAPKVKCVLYAGAFDPLSKIVRHYMKGLSKTVKMGNAFRIPSDAELKRFNYFIGVMQNCKMVEAIHSRVFKAFKFLPFDESSANANLSKRLKEENSVSLHIRKGNDYISRSAYSGTCSAEYYLDAVNYIREHVNNPVFYVFTDNTEWVRNNLMGFKYNLVDWNPTIGWGNHFDMQLMSLCKHNIIANSTYSWWGAFLNANPDKIVISPKQWFNKNFYDGDTTEYTLCKEWIAF